VQSLMGFNSILYRWFWGFVFHCEHCHRTCDTLADDHNRTCDTFGDHYKRICDTFWDTHNRTCDTSGIITTAPVIPSGTITTAPAVPTVENTVVFDWRHHHFKYRAMPLHHLNHRAKTFFTATPALSSPPSISIIPPPRGSELANRRGCSTHSSQGRLDSRQPFWAGTRHWYRWS
jgi:hypothetical protein